MEERGHAEVTGFTDIENGDTEVEATSRDSTSIPTKPSPNPQVEPERSKNAYHPPTLREPSVRPLPSPPQESPTNPPPSVFLDITIGGQPLTRLPLELYPTPSSLPFHAQCVSAPPGYKNSRITRIMPGVGIYGGSDAAAPAHAPQQFGGAGSGKVLEEGEVAWAAPGGGGGGGGQARAGGVIEGNGYVISLGGARGEAIGRVFGEKGVEGLRMLASTGVGRRGEGVPDLEVGVGMCGEL